MSRLRSWKTKHRRWLALVLAAVTLSVALAIWLYASPPRPKIPGSPLQPWFLVEGANASWDVRRKLSDTWQNSTGYMFVLNVSEDNILFRVTDGDSSLNLTMPVGRAYDVHTTLGAWIQSRSGGLEVLDYRAELLVLDEPVARFAALSETATYVDVSGTRTTSQRVLELPQLLLVREEVTVVADFGGPPFEWYETRTLIGVDGIDLVQPGNVLTESINLAGLGDALELLFNGDTLTAGFEGDDLVVEARSRTASILAAIIRRDVLVSLRDFDASLEDFLWPLNGTRALFGLLLEPGSSRFAFEIAQTPSPSGAAAAVPSGTTREKRESRPREVESIL